MKKLSAASIVLFVLAILVLTPGLSFAEDTKYVLICNKDIPVTSLDKKTVENIFLGKTAKIESVKVTLSVQESGEAHEAFLKDCVGKTSSQFSSYWKTQVFSGKGTMPKSFKTDKELIEYVSKTEGAIGYIAVETSKDTGLMAGVKTVTVN